MTKERLEQSPPGDNERVTLFGGPRDGTSFVTSAGRQLIWFLNGDMAIVPEVVYASPSPIHERRSRYRRVAPDRFEFDGWDGETQ